MVLIVKGHLKNIFFNCESIQVRCLDAFQHLNSLELVMYDFNAFIDVAQARNNDSNIDAKLAVGT